MKRPLFLLLVFSAICYGCTSAVEVKNIASMRPIIPKSGESKPVMFKKVVYNLPRTKAIGSVQEGMLCMPKSNIYWQGGKLYASPEEFGEILKNELERNQFTVVGDPNALFEDESTWKAEYLIGARISDIAANICYPGSVFGNLVKSKGEAYIEVEWHIYSRKTRDVVLKFKAEGSAKIDKAMPGGDNEVILQAFSVAVNNMLADREFFELVSLDKDILELKQREEEAFDPVKVGFKRLNDPQMKKDFNKKNMINKLRTATVTIFAGDGHGSGFIISDDGYVLTNAHVVGGAKFVQVRLVTGSEKTGEVIRRHKERDVALVKLEGDLYPFAILGNSANVNISDEVYAIGAPLKEQLSHSVSKGIVSSFRVIDDIRYIQSDVTIQPGNSGGPLISEEYGVVGIAVQGEIMLGIVEDGLDRRTVGLNYFIPIEEATELLKITKKE